MVPIPYSDFKYKKQLYSLQTFQQILHVSMMKNLLISGSSERILIHDMAQKINVCYLAIQPGISFTTYDYYQLWIAYPAPDLTLRSVWLNRVITLTDVKYEFGCFSNKISPNASDCPLLCLVSENTLSIYKQNNLLIVHEVQTKVGPVFSFEAHFYSFMDDRIILQIDQKNIYVLKNPIKEESSIEKFFQKNNLLQQESNDFDLKNLFGGQGQNGKCIYAVTKSHFLRYDLKSSIIYQQFQSELRQKKKMLND